jgi:predicted nucleic-acid-binding protein
VKVLEKNIVIGIDTNSLVCFLTADDKQNYDLAVDLISTNQELFVSITVMMNWNGFYVQLTK